MKRKSVLIALGILVGILLGGCSSTREGKEAVVLSLAHNMSESHTVHIALEDFAKRVDEKSAGRLQIKIFPNGQLGSEVEVLEQLMAGVLAMTKVSAPGLATYDEAYHTFGLPYVFDDTQHFYQVMDSKPMRDFFLSTGEKGFVGLTYYTSGSRSFYTVNKPIRKPEDLKGLKIRVQDMKSQTDMVKALGGTPVAMAYGDVYTSLQTGIIDGTENNETALTTGKHGEICKYYSVDEHAMIPDVLVMSQTVWEQLSEEDQRILLEAAYDSTQNHKVAWEDAIEDAVTKAKEDMGVIFVEDVDKEAFRDATKGMIEEYSSKYPKVGNLLDIINSIK